MADTMHDGDSRGDHGYWNSVMPDFNRDLDSLARTVRNFAALLARSVAPGRPELTTVERLMRRFEDTSNQLHEAADSLHDPAALGEAWPEARAFLREQLECASLRKRFFALVCLLHGCIVDKTVTLRRNTMDDPFTGLSAMHEYADVLIDTMYLRSLLRVVVAERSESGNGSRADEMQLLDVEGAFSELLSCLTLDLHQFFAEERVSIVKLSTWDILRDDDLTSALRECVAIVDSRLAIRLINVIGLARSRKSVYEGANSL